MFKYSLYFWLMKNRPLYIFFLLAVLNSYLKGQNENYFSYSLDQGLPQSQVFDITQDEKGFIWAATQGGGLTKFDGIKFKTYTTQDGLSSDFVNALLYDKNGDQIYIATSRGLNVLKGEKINTFSFENRSIFFTVISQSKNLLFCGTSSGIIILDKQISKQIRMPEFDVLNNHYINDIEKVENEIWIGTNKGLWIYNINDKKLIKSNKAPQPNVAKIYYDNVGYVWMSILDYGILKIQSSSKSIITKIDNDEIKKTLALNLDSKNNLWIGTQYNGLYKYDIEHNKLEIIKDRDFTSTKLRALYRDKWENLWICTSGEGIIKRANQPIKHIYPSQYGYKSNKIYSITNYINNQILFTTGDNQIISFDGSRFNSIYQDSAKIKMKSLVVDSSYNIWVGTEGKGIIKISRSGDKEIKSYSNGNFIDDIIVQLVEGKNNEIWIATHSSGIVHMVNGNPTYINSRKGLISDYIAGIALDSKKNLWYATKEGSIGYVTPNYKIHRIKTSSELEGQSIKSIVVDKMDNIYFTIIGEGLYRYNALTKSVDKVKSMGKNFSTNIYSMKFTPNGHLWLGAENGCYEVIFDPSLNVAQVEYFTKGDGYLGLESCHNSTSLQGNNLWFGTMNGISVLNYKNEKAAKLSPILNLSKILLFYKPIDETNYANDFYIKKSLPYDQNHISFQFKAVHLNHSDKIKYRYKLDGADQSWSSWVHKDEVNYANLSPENYTFEVQASLDGKFLSNVVRVPFTISPPFWKMWWFRIASLGMILGSVFYFIKKREKIIKEKEAQKNKDLEMQNQLLSLEQKALQLQMNPHFIFNALNSIQSVIVDQDVEKARQEIQNFALLMRSILNNSRKKSISISEELQTIRKYLEIEQFCQKNKFTFDIKIDENIDVDDVEIPSMLLQPYIENAVIHGISHLKQNGKLTINFSLEDDVLHCEIVDNGVGRLKARELSFGAKSHVSLGMDVTETRLKNYAKDKIDQPQSIIDLYDDNGRAMGTKVILKIPTTTSY
jgi:ligand-binding sensor domain-containing protein